MDNDLFERILIPLADSEDAERTARAVRPHLTSGTTLVVTHVNEGGSGETTVETGRDEFAESVYERFHSVLFSILDPDDIQFEWVTLQGREVSEALADAVGIVDPSLVVFTPRDIDDWDRTLAGDPGGQLIRATEIPVMVFPARTL